MTLLPNGTLRIANATRQDAGSYTCVAKNQFGTASTTGKLLITGESGTPSLFPCALQVILREPSEQFPSHICPHLHETAVPTSDVSLNGAASRWSCIPKGANTPSSLWKWRTILASALDLRGPWTSLCLQLKRSCFVLIILIICRYSIIHVLIHVLIHALTAQREACLLLSHTGLRKS